MMSNPDVKTTKPFIGVLLPAVQAACGATRNNRIGVIGTATTIKSGGYGKAIEQKSLILLLSARLVLCLCHWLRTDTQARIIRLLE